MIHQPNLNFNFKRKQKTMEEELREAGLLDLAKEINLPIDSSPLENSYNSLITNDEDTIKAKDKAKKLSSFPKINVLIIGDTGTGKELIARIIHGNSKGRFIGINTAGIPDGLLESEFFGSVTGAFTGATNRIGLIEEAENGTLFLDEIGDMPRLLQAKLLRAIQEKEIRAVGSNKSKPFNCRIISATNRKVDELCNNHHGFRTDLYYRLAGSIIELKPLNERGDDWIKILRTQGINLNDYPKDKIWNGNIRELLNWANEYKALNS